MANFKPHFKVKHMGLTYGKSQLIASYANNPKNEHDSSSGIGWRCDSSQQSLCRVWWEEATDGNRWHSLWSKYSPIVQNRPTMGQRMDRGGGRMAASYFKIVTVSQFGDSETSTSLRVDCVIYRITRTELLYHGNFMHICKEQVFETKGVFYNYRYNFVKTISISLSHFHVVSTRPKCCCLPSQTILYESHPYFHSTKGSWNLSDRLKRRTNGKGTLQQRCWSGASIPSVLL